MSASDSNQGSRAAYDFWLGTISQLLDRIGGGLTGGAPSSVPEGLPYPVDQVAKAAAMTQQLLQGMSQALAPALQAGVPSLLAQLAKPLAAFTSTSPGDSTSANLQPMFAPWLAFMSNAATSMPAASAFMPGAGTVPSQAPLHSVSQAWIDMASRFTGTSPAQVDTNFDRAYGAISDGVGLGPARKLYSAWRDVMSTSVAQQDARSQYTGLLQSAYAQGFQRLLIALAAKADADERVESVLALIRLWTINTEQAVHETLQSEPGLAATAALIRSDLAHRKKTQQMAAVLADQFDMASRHELDEAFREIQVLKRELRAIQTAGGGRPATVRRATARKTGAAKKPGQAGLKKSENG